MAREPEPDPEVSTSIGSAPTLLTETGAELTLTLGLAVEAKEKLVESAEVELWEFAAA